MSYRIAKFRSFANDPWWGKRVKTLRASDLEWCEAWIVEHDHLEQGPFEFCVNRMWLDNPALRDSFGKRWTQMDELIANANVGHGSASRG